MKKIVSLLVLILSLMLTACSAPKKGPTPVSLDIAVTTPPGDSPAPEVATTLPDNATPSDAGKTIQTSSALEIVPTDNGKTFTYHVGDSFLLDLGTDIYDWEVTIADENILTMKKGVMVIQGAQGIYDALATGTTTLTAVGSPKCLQSQPPCGMPTLLFKVTIVVQ